MPKIIGINIQNKNIIPPTNTTNDCTIIPTIIKKDLIIAPIILEKILEIKVLKNCPRSNPLGYIHLYLLHGEKNVFSKSGTEKKLALNEI